MPLNSVTYLESHGWEGKGIPLDGKQGRGLKKPLALPMKRNLKGLGKDRDRAVEWWDCLFEASAKSINIRVESANESARETSLVESIISPRKEAKDELKGGTNLSLESRAKRELARKMLMSGFVRGREVKKSAAEEELEERLRQQEKKKLSSNLMNGREVSNPTAKETTKVDETKEIKARRKLEKRERRERKEAKKRKREKAEITLIKEDKLKVSDSTTNSKRKSKEGDMTDESKGETEKIKKRKRDEE